MSNFVFVLDTYKRPLDPVHPNTVRLSPQPPILGEPISSKSPRIEGFGGQRELPDRLTEQYWVRSAHPQKCLCLNTCGYS